MLRDLAVATFIGKARRRREAKRLAELDAYYTALIEADGAQQADDEA